MTLPTPKLDDRSFEEIVNNALAKIPNLCPQWTDFNPSDPGRTLIELMAWMTEIILYRLNRVPEKNYIKFLELMGITLQPAQPARTWLVFSLAKEKSEDAMPQIPAGTRVCTRPETEKPVVFETCAPLKLTTARIIDMFAQYGEILDKDIWPLEKHEPEGVAVFCKDLEKRIPNRVSHILYLGDSRLGSLVKGTVLKLSVNMENPLFGSLHVEWERWDGKAWEIVLPARDETRGLSQSGEITFESLPKMEESEISGIHSYWLRVRLVGSDTNVLPVIKSLKRSLELAAEDSVLPEKAYLRIEPHTYLPIDFSREFYPLGRPAKPVKPSADSGGEFLRTGKEFDRENIFFLGSSLFSKSNTRISIWIKIPEDDSPLEASEIRWEYYTVKKEWKPLGIKEHDFLDGTSSLTRNGIISFDRPQDMAPFEIHGEQGWYICASFSHGSDEYDRTRPPLIKTLAISFSEHSQNWEHYIAENYSSYDDFTAQASGNKPFEPFLIKPEKDYAFYLGFSSRTANMQRIYFEFAEQDKETVARIAEAVPAKISWEYWCEKGYWALNVLKDGTRGLTQKGAIEFVGPADWQEKTEMSGKPGYWLRARWEVVDYPKCPRLKGVHPNAVEARQATSIRNEVLGSSNGEPFQTFRLTKVPILPQPRIIVKEAEADATEKIERLGELLHDGVIEEVIKEPDGAWVLWREVDSLYKSDSKSRHYIMDIYEGTITFGDGKRGMIPPAGRENIKAAVYSVTEGARGNVGKNTVTVLETPHPPGAKVRNVELASGGADPETIEEAKLRGPWTLKHRYRAVTKEDFEHLAKEASSEVAKATCYEGEDAIQVIVLPKTGSDKPRPSFRLIQKVTEYLDARRLITTRLRVGGPEYEGIYIEISVVLTAREVGRFPQIRIDMERALKKVTHPLHGGPDSKGWPMGRTVHISEIYYLLESISGVDYVKKVRMKKWAGQQEEKIRIGPKSFPYLREIVIKQV